MANGQINLTGSQTISVPTTAIAGKKDVTVSIWLKNNYGNGNTGQPEWLREIRNDQCHCGRPE